jgi:hypothetical protein
VTFRWDYSQSLSPSKAFQVLIWKKGAESHNGAAQFTDLTEQLIDLEVVSQVADGGQGEYFWSVVVVDESTERRTSPEAPPRPFIYTGEQSDRKKQPTPTPGKEGP